MGVRTMPDVRLIDAGSTKEKLGFAIEPFIGSAADEIRNDTLLDAIKIVDSMPTVDAQPVKRGKWRLVVERVITSKYACSECDSVYAIPSELSPEGFYCYCPNCGAKMRR